MYRGTSQNEKHCKNETTKMETPITITVIMKAAIL